MWYSMIGCLLTIALGLIISAIVNAVQKHRVLKINSSKTTNNIVMHPETNLPTENNPTPFGANTTDVEDVQPVSTEAGGHINHAIRLDDE